MMRPESGQWASWTGWPKTNLRQHHRYWSRDPGTSWFGRRATRAVKTKGMMPARCHPSSWGWGLVMAPCGRFFALRRAIECRFSSSGFHPVPGSQTKSCPNELSSLMAKHTKKQVPVSIAA